jgi:hypothetical protein
VDALEAFHKDHKPKFLHAELVVLNDIHAYGGRFDAIAETKDGTFLIDYKTGGHYEAALAMQQVAYMHGNIATYDDEGRLGEFLALPRIDGARGIYLHEDGTYEVVDPFKNISQELAWEGFTACLKLYNTVKAFEIATKEEK